MSPHTYDAFISYSHQADRALAPRLQQLIRRVGQPWYRRSRLRVFRDETNLALAPDLWQEIENALGRSRQFVLLASPGAAASPWVEREIRYWREHRDRASLSIVLTAGQIAWDTENGDFDWSEGGTTALPPALKGWFAKEPVWANLVAPADGPLPDDRVRDAAREIAARVTGVDKDQIDGEDEREHRRARRTGYGALVVLVVLLVLALVAAFEATRQAKTALARQLAATSAASLATNLDAAGPLAVRAYRTEVNPQTRAAMFGAVTASGPLVRYLRFPAKIEQIATGDEAVVVGLADGKLMRWRAGEPELLHDFGSTVLSISMDRSGSVITASAENNAVLLRPGTEKLLLGKGQSAAVSPSGKTVVVNEHKALSLTVMRLDGTPVDRVSLPVGLRSWSETITSDEEVVVLDQGQGDWERRKLRDGGLVATSSSVFGTWNYGVVTSGDLERFGYSNGATTVRIWRTDVATNYDKPPFRATAPIARPSAMALSRDGRFFAAAESGAIHVSPVSPWDDPSAQSTKLLGNNSINANGLRFLGADDTRLVSSSGDRLVLWDLAQHDRISRTYEVPLGYGCRPCAGPQVELTADARNAVVVDSLADKARVLSLDDGAAQELPRPSLLSSAQRPIWTHDGKMVVGMSSPGKAQSPEWLRMPQVSGAVLGAAPRGGLLVQAKNEILTVDGDSGEVRTKFALPGEIPDPSTNAVWGVANPAGTMVAIAGPDAVWVIDAETQRVVNRIVLGRAADVAFGSGYLLVQAPNGDMQVWDEKGGTHLRTLSGGEEYLGTVVAAPVNGLAAAVRSDGSTVLFDLDSGTQLATFRPATEDPSVRTGLNFSRDGTRLISATEAGPTGAGRVVVRDVSDDALVRASCAASSGPLSAEQWKALVGTDAPDDLNCG